MTDKVTALISLVDELLAAIKELEPFCPWLAHFEDARGELLKGNSTGTAWGTAIIIGAFGGSGSFNDYSFGFWSTKTTEEKTQNIGRLSHETCKLAEDIKKNGIAY